MRAEVRTLLRLPHILPTPGRMILPLYPLCVALGTEVVCTSICQVDQVGAAWQRWQVVLHREAHGCLQGLSILGQQLSVEVALSIGQERGRHSTQGFSACQ